MPLAINSDARKGTIPLTQLPPGRAEGANVSRYRSPDPESSWERKRAACGEIDNDAAARWLRKHDPKLRRRSKKLRRRKTA